MADKTSKELEIKVVAALAEGHSLRQVAKTFGIGKSTAGRIRKDYADAPPKEQEHVKPNFGKLPSKKIDVLAELKRLAAISQKHGKDDDYRKIEIPATGMIAVMKAADLHLGGLDIDYQSLLEHYEFLLTKPNFYLQLFGDDINLMVMHKTVSARHDVLTPEEQTNLLENMVDELLSRGKILSMGSGNHSDEFTERTAGFGITRALMKYKVPYFRGMGYIDLVVGKVRYGQAFAHKTRFNSFMNPAHGAKRMQQMHAEYFGKNRQIADEYITAHTHNPHVSHEGCLPEDRIWYVKCGTFKTNCLYSQRYFGQGRIGVPTAVYHPEHKSVVYLPTPWDADRYMAGGL